MSSWCLKVKSINLWFLHRLPNPGAPGRVGQTENLNPKTQNSQTVNIFYSVINAAAAETGIYWDKWISILAADVLAPIIASDDILDYAG